jgi:hypothetical protein
MSYTSREPVSLDPPGTALSRVLQGMAYGLNVSELVTTGAWRSTPQVDTWTKAAVPIGTTTDATWAGPLATPGIAREVLSLLKDVSLFEQLKPRMRQVPFLTSVPREIGGGSAAYWIDEALSIPATKTSYDRITVGLYKVAVLTVVTKELVRLADPVTERAIRDAVLAGVSRFIDAQFLSPAIDANATRPASITNGATAITSTGATAAAILADLSAMLAAITSAGRGLVWVMKPTTAAHIAGTLGASAGSDFPRLLFGLPVVLNANSPPQVTLLDAPDILFADGDVELSGSGRALVQSDDAPSTPPASSVVSLWQQDLWGLRVVRDVAWLRGRDGAVSYMVVAY